MQLIQTVEKSLSDYFPHDLHAGPHDGNTNTFSKVTGRVSTPVALCTQRMPRVAKEIQSRSCLFNALRLEGISGDLQPDDPANTESEEIYFNRTARK